MDQFEVFPHKDGSWNWRKRVSGKSAETGGGYDSRRDAIAAAREANGAERVGLVRADGSSAGTAQLRGGTLRVVLLRLDGSVHGELDPPPSAGGGVQLVTLTPAVEGSEAGLDG